MINITVPTNQTPKVNSFGEGMNISVAKGTKKLGDPQVKGVAFHNVCSYLKFTVPSYIPNVNRVDVTCDRNIAGSTTINYEALGSDKDTVIGSGSEKTITMEGSFAEGSTFWFVLTPGVVNSLTINLTTADGSHWTRTSTKTFTLNIGTPKNLGTIDFALTNASAIHTTDTDGETLNGTEVKVNLGIISSLMSSVTAVNLQVANSSGEVVRTYIRNYNDLDKLTDNSVTFPTNSDWPYLPRGTYTISGTYTIDGTIKNFAQTSFISPKPEFIVNTPSAHTSYDTYKKSGADAANAEDGSTIYKIINTGVKISEKILTKDKYASLKEGYSYTIDDGNKAEEGDNANQSWGAHKVVAKYTFDGVTMSSPELTCNVTGLPYKNDFQSNFSGWYGNNKLDIKSGGLEIPAKAGYAISPEFYVPANINITFTYDLYNNGLLESTRMFYHGVVKNQTSSVNTNDGKSTNAARWTAMSSTKYIFDKDNYHCIFFYAPNQTTYDVRVRNLVINYR